MLRNLIKDKRFPKQETVHMNCVSCRCECKCRGCQRAEFQSKHSIVDLFKRSLVQA